MEPNKSLPCTTLPCITVWLKGSTVYSWNTNEHFFIQAHFQNFSGKKWSNMQSGWRTEQQLVHSQRAKPHMRCFMARNPIWQDWGNGEQWSGSMTPSGTKLDGRSRIGWWFGFKEVNNAHQIFQPDNCSVTVEWNIKFDHNDLLICINHNAPQQEVADLN